MKILNGKDKGIRFFLTVFFFLFLWTKAGISAEAAEAAVTFGSTRYEWKSGEVCPIGVYFNGAIAVNSYMIHLEYDPEKLKYLGGADRVEGNQLFLEGGGGELQYKRMLHFEPITDGNTAIRIVEAVGMGGNAAEDGTVTEEEFVLAQYPEAPVAVLKKSSHKLKSLTVEGAEKMETFSPELLEYHLEVPYEVEELDVLFETEDENAQVRLSETRLQQGENRITIEVGEILEEPLTYTLYVKRLNPVQVKEETEENKPAANDKPITNEKSTEAAADQKPDQTDTAAEEEMEKKQTETSSKPVSAQVSPNETNKLDPVLFAALIIIGIIVLIQLIFWLLKRYKQEKEEPNNWEEDTLSLINLEQTVIDVRNVSMNFRLAQDEPSSLKEYLIRALKGNNRYRTLKALCNVSFEVKQSEVIGIVGTNGSGKSTLLKIIAGALLPSEGEVITDHNKVQMLTLGTGFDMELTARENVYLNGAIIGYSKEYIDEKFKDIVAFAELEGFMDERMKNFSSGMVSRLGFAIATMRDTPEILILDEVLSVGDMFFRNKSEKRIQEMIQTGAAVLIVSHSAAVITKNCDRAVWLDKGILRMVGNPKEVCKAYADSGKA